MLLTITRMGLDRGQSQEPADEYPGSSDFGNICICMAPRFIISGDSAQEFSAQKMVLTSVCYKSCSQLIFVSQGAFQKRGRVATLQVDLCHFIGRIGLPREY